MWERAKGLTVDPQCVYNYENAIGNRVMETENGLNVFSVSITHNSKIRELSDGNKKLETELWVPNGLLSYGSHYF